MAVPLALVVVVAIIGATLVVATAVISYKVYSSRPKLESEVVDLESQEPVRKLRVRHGRVVSTTSTIFSASQHLVRWPAARMSSRPSSIGTLDLEEDIKAYRQDYPPLPRDSDGNIIGIPPERAERKSLHPIVEKPEQTQPRQSPSRTHFTTTRSSRRITSPEPVPNIVESSWRTYNGHRKSNDVLSSPIKSPSRLDLDPSPAHIQPPQSAKSRNSTQRPRLTKTRSKETLRQPESVSSTSITGEPNTREIITQPIAPKPHKPVRLKLVENSSKELDYGFPSPPPSSTFSSQPYLLTANIGFVSPPTSVSPVHTSIYVSDIESRPSRGDSRRRSSSVNSRSSSRSRHRSKSKHRVRKRQPPPINTARVFTMSTTSATSLEQETEPDSATFLSSPAQSEVTLAPMRSIGRLAGRKAARLSVQTFASSDLSPTFAVSPVFRVPLYAGKGPRGPKVRVVGSGDNNNSSKRGRPSVLRTQTGPNFGKTNSNWPPSDICTMLMQAHDIAQSLDPTTPPPKRSSSVTTEELSKPGGQRLESVQDANRLRPSSSQDHSLSAHESAMMSQTDTTGVNVEDDAKRSKTRESLRPGLSKARSLSGNITLSSDQTKAHEERNTGKSGEQLPRSSHELDQGHHVKGAMRRNRYDHIIDNKPSASPPRKDSTASMGSERIAPSSGPLRKGSLPTLMPEASPSGPPDPAVLSKILGLTPPSPSAESPKLDSPNGSKSAPLRSFGLPSDTPKMLLATSAGAKSARGVGLDVRSKSKRSSRKVQLLAGGKENALRITAKELEVDGGRRGAISVNSVRV